MLGLLIASGAFGASTIYLAVQLREERAQADAFAEQSRALSARIAELEKVRAGLEATRLAGETVAASELVQGGKASVTSVQGEPVALTNEVRQAEPGDRVGPSFGGAPRSEAMQKMVRAQIRANFKRMNPDIGAKLGLSAEDSSKLVDLMIDQQMAMMERAREGRGANQAPEQRAADVSDQQQKNLAEIAALIGADKMDAYKAYQEAAPARQEVDMLSRQLEANDLNLSRDQRDRMVTALADERQRVPPPKYSEAVSREEFSKDMTAWQEDYNQRAATRASSILTSEQQATYSEYQQWTKEMRQQFETRRAARDGGAGPRGAPPGTPSR
ncbi:MAG TPA: hypothetical protein VM146_15375 [Steroidobacteraceae bacterium]|nr:hypothetical protein [Steroidobacteraceae bacterium]